MFRPLFLALCLAAPVAAQTVGDCDTWQTSARNLAEPWEANSRTFANGDIRVALLDTIEPAAPLRRFDPATGGFLSRRLDVTINQATGLITARAY